jgi:DNA repair photolyase
MAKSIINSMPHTKFSVLKGLSCRSSMNLAFGCETFCSFCYIRYLTRWKGMAPNDIFRKIHIRINAAELLDKEVRNRPKEWIWVGSTSDPYQDYEHRYGLMRRCLEVFRRYHYPFEVITKSPLVARDVDLLGELQDVGLVSVSFTTINEDKRRSVELRARSTRERLDALRKLNAAGVRTCALLLPIIPGYTDDEQELQDLIREIAAAGTTNLYAGVMRLYPITWAGMRKAMSPRLAALRNDIQQRYYETTKEVSAGARVPDRQYRRTLMGRVREICRASGIASYSCEDNFFDLWYGPQDDHGSYRYAVHYDFWQERRRLNVPALTGERALAVARRFRHTPSYLRSIQQNLDLLNRLIAGDV